MSERATIQTSIPDALDECIELLKEGRTAEQCFEERGDCIDQLQPLVRLARQLLVLPRIRCSNAAFDNGKLRMLQALKEKNKEKQELLAL